MFSRKIAENDFCFRFSRCEFRFSYNFDTYLRRTKLTRLNNKILIFFLQNQSVITSHYVFYPEYNTLPPQLLHKYQILILVHKFLYHKHLLPIIYLDYFTLNFVIRKNSY